MSDGKRMRGLTRREVLAAGGATAAVGAAVLRGCGYDTQLFLIRPVPETTKRSTAWEGSRVRSYRKLGRTGFEMSDISFGTSALSDPQVVRRAIERGVNYFDTSPDYSDTRSEKALGEGIKGTPRDKLFIVSKWCTSGGHLPVNAPVKKVIEAFEGSLKRLGTDYIDLAHIHAVDTIERLMAPGIHEAFDKLRAAGKIRFLGVSSHTPHLEKVMRHAVDSDRFDVIMVAYNFKNWPDLTNIFRDAHRKGVGVVAMKTLKGARHTQLADFTESERQSFPQAAFKWVLSNPHVSGLVVTMRSLPQIDEYLYASGQPLKSEDVALLERYDALIARDYCRPGCGDCLDACPYGVPVDDILRYAMYAENYGQEKEALRLYAKLDPARRADHCLGCGAPCERSCTFGLPIRDKLTRAHELLTI